MLYRFPDTLIMEAGFALPVIFTDGGVVAMVSETPVCKVLAVAPAMRSLANTLVGMMCAFTIAATASTGAALIDASVGKPAAVNAALVGANTVNLAGSLIALTNPALVTAATNKDKSGVAMAISAMVFSGTARTEEITWIMPLEALTSAVFTFTPLTNTPLAFFDAKMYSPCKEATVSLAGTAEEATRAVSA